MNVGPYPPQQPGSGAFAFNHNNAAAAYPYQASSSSSYYGGGSGSGSFTPRSNASLNAGTSQAFVPPQTGYGNDNGQTGAMASTAANIMHAQNLVGQQFPYTTTPYTQSISAQAPTPSALSQPIAQQILQQNHSASPQPQSRGSPNAAGQQQVQQPKTQTPPIRHTMAAPPLPQSPATMQQPGTNSASPSSAAPQSPGSAIREQQRVALLLDINAELLQELNKLIASGAGGLTSMKQVSELNANGQNGDMASDDFMHVFRRLQANLAYLMPLAQNGGSRTAKGPATMSAPPHMPQIQPRYDQLKELFPGWVGVDFTTQQQLFGRG
ncbi:hypothetical protein LTR86_002007 [Recurvomyces mirabilis]|nr:hypothetical protein LTR86_002007 [Recurvomyces mirabilis]